ncbi:MAG: bifunctional DNA primase/polymerase [Phycisphaerae bacterium]
MAESLDIMNSAMAYLDAGLCVLPARRAQKRPSVGRWKQYQKTRPTGSELSAWLANSPDALCILCGQASGNAEILDFDARGELFDRWCAKVRTAAPGLLERLVLSRTQSDGRHAFYRCQTLVSGNLKLAQRKVGDKVVTLIETRGEGGLFLCAPTAGYEVIQGDLANPPVLTEEERDVLLQAAWDLNEYLPPVVNGPTLSTPQATCATDIATGGDCSSHTVPVTSTGPLSFSQGHCAADNPHPGDCASHSADVVQTSPLSTPQAAYGADNAGRPGDDFNIRGDVRAILVNAGWVLAKPGENEYWRRPGKTNGWSATLKDRVFYVFSANANPFEPGKAYSPFGVYTLLEHRGDYTAAASALRILGFGQDVPIADGVDISGIIAQATPAADPPAPRVDDPGPVPVELLRIPGFIGELMDHSLATAPYPSQVMAFCGAVALQSFLAARKVRDPGDNRTNLYLLGLAYASGGKDWPRKINAQLMHQIGMGHCLGHSFASGEGLQDALFLNPAMLFQTDEIDTMLQAISKSKDARYENLMGTLLTMYTSSASVYPMRRKAGKENPGAIDQPSLTIFGTAVPTHYYEALSARMLTNGFFARMIVLDAGVRAEGQEPQVPTLPERLVQTARWWADFQPGERVGNLYNVHPVPKTVPHSDEAKALLIETRKSAEAEYRKAESRADEVGTTVWGRVSENTRKLALIYAVSENALEPVIGREAVSWASEFMRHQTRRMLFMASQHVAEGEFDAECLKVIRKLSAAPEGALDHSVLLKRMKMESRRFLDLVGTLIQRGDIETITVPTAGRSGVKYRLRTAPLVKEGGAG